MVCNWTFVPVRTASSPNLYPALPHHLPGRRACTPPCCLPHLPHHDPSPPLPHPHTSLYASPAMGRIIWADATRLNAFRRAARYLFEHSAETAFLFCRHLTTALTFIRHRCCIRCHNRRDMTLLVARHMVLHSLRRFAIPGGPVGCVTWIVPGVATDASGSTPLLPGRTAFCSTASVRGRYLRRYCKTPTLPFHFVLISTFVRL